VKYGSINQSINQSLLANAISTVSSKQQQKNNIIVAREVT